MKISHLVVAMSICLSAVSEGVFSSAIFIYAEKVAAVFFWVDLHLIYIFYKIRYSATD